MDLINGVLEITWVQNLLIAGVTLLPVILGTIKALKGFKSFVPFVKSELRVINAEYGRFIAVVGKVLKENEDLRKELKEIRGLLIDALQHEDEPKL